MTICLEGKGDRHLFRSWTGTHWGVGQEDLSSLELGLVLIAVSLFA